jgi:hypothetical protein
MIKKRCKNILFFLIGIFFLGITFFGCESTDIHKTQKTTFIEKPLWLDNPEAGGSNRLFLSAVGMGYSEQDARSNATVALATSIQQNISSTLTAKTSESSINNQFSSATASINETIQTATIVDDLIGVYIKEYWTDQNKMVYALAQINRIEATAYYTQQINNNNEIINENLEFADASKEKFEAFTYIQKCIPLANKNRNYFTILSVVNNNAFNTLTVISPVELSNKSQKAASKISIGILVNEDRNNLIYSTLAKTFTSYGFVVGEADLSNYPYVLNVQLSFVTKTGLRYIEVNCHSDISLIDANTKMTVMSDSHDDRISHNDESLAKSRAYTVLANYMSKEYKSKFESFVQGE